MPYYGNRERVRVLRRLKELLEKEMGCKYKLYYPEYQDSIDLVWDIERKEIPVVFRPRDLGADDICLEMMERQWSEELWVKDWTDPDPAAVDNIVLFQEYARIYCGKSMPFWFMVEKYYYAYVIDVLDTLWKREDRMKAALIIPAAIKDLMVLDKTLDKALSKYDISRSEVIIGQEVFDENLYPFLDFYIGEMGEDELIENLLKRAKAMSEWWRDFRAWLASLERREFYESTRVKKPWEDGRKFIKICKWPYEEPHREHYETEIRREFANYPNALIYNLDRYRVRLVDNEIVIDCTERIEPIPLEKIGFLREDFPELFEDN